MSDDQPAGGWPLWSGDETPPPGLYEWTPTPAEAPPPSPPEPPVQRPPADASTTKLRPARRPTCLECGGRTDRDGYCTQCGAKVPTPREHFEQAPTPWVGGVCDRGVQHSRNEDAMALWASPEPERNAILVVCDGVSNSTDSDVAALAAAEAARAALIGSQPAGMGIPASHDAALAEALTTAAAAANQAVVDNTPTDEPNPASCTFAAAVVHDDVVHFANLGDSRVYWIGTTLLQQLSTDDSMAEELIRAGTDRVSAETSEQAHAITRWLGRDAPDLVPTTGTLRPGEDGWVVVCSDGLWNYASEPSQLAEQLLAATVESSEPVAVARRLVAWATAQGGRDNITVALARLATKVHTAPEVQAPGAGER